MKAFPSQLFAVQNGGGGVTGPSSSTDNAVTAFDGTGGAIQERAITISDEASSTVTVTAAGAGAATHLVISSEGAGFFEIRVPGAETIYFSTNGGARWSIDSSGTLAAAHVNARLVVQGSARLKGSTSSAADPSTSEFASNEWGLHKNTTSGIWYLAVNDGGAIKKVALS